MKNEKEIEILKSHNEAEESLANLLQVEKIEDGRVYDWFKYASD